MNVTDYTYLINKPDAITEKQTEALGNVLIEFPYFQSARALRLKGLYSQNSFKYNYALKVAAAHTADRSVLFDFITSETYTSIQNEYYDQKLKDLLNITVFGSEVVKPEIPKIPEVRIDPIEQSILSSIREATTVVFEQKKTEEPEPVVAEQPTIISAKEETPITIESFAETPSHTLTEETPVATEETATTQEITLDSFVEQDSAPVQEETPAIIEEPEAVHKITIDSFVEQTDSASEEETSISIKEPIAVQEVTIDSFVEQPVSASSEEETLIITEEEKEKTVEVRIDPIEESVYDSIRKATTVIFEKPEAIVETEEVPEILQTPEVPEQTIIEEPKETEETEVPENVKIAEENLEIGKPLDFVNEKHSFQEWLQLAKTEPIDRTKEAPSEDSEPVIKTEITEEPINKVVTPKENTEIIDEEKKKKAELIDKFIEANPKIVPIKSGLDTAPAQFDINKEENPYLMTETLARVYLEQKKFTKAIQAYEILILKYPEKISFFADRISDIKILQQNNNNNN